MALIPTTQELADSNLTRLETSLNQTAPLQRLAFLRVLAAMEALNGTGLYKFAVDRIKQTLALTATDEGLDALGAEYETPRKLAESAVLTVTLPALTGTLIPATAGFIGSSNGERYFLDFSVTAAAGVATLSLTAENPGADGNLANGAELNIISAVAGAEQTATVTGTTTTGADEETDTAYRPRVLFAIRATTGGSNATDHKIWAEEVAGVLRAFPFGGKPVGGGTSYPGDRTVYIEADATIDPDGIPPTGLLDDVRAALLIDPDTGLSRPALGLVDANLYVEPIIRNSVDVTIQNLVTPAGAVTEVRDAIEDALDEYFSLVSIYVEGVDLPQERNDQITALSLALVVQEVLETRASSAEDVSFEVAATPYDIYILAPNELVKTGTVTYVTV